MTQPIILVVGARPNFMKIAPIYAELSKRGENLLLLHTGQHYDDNMSKVFFDDLGMPKPDLYLGIGSGSHAYQTATVMIEFEKICMENNPSMVVVVGDVNSTVACSIVCAKLRIHVLTLRPVSDLSTGYARRNKSNYYRFDCRSPTDPFTRW